MELSLNGPRLVEVNLGSASIKARIPIRSDMLAMRRKHVSIITRRGEQVEQLDEVGYSVDFWDYTIESWSNVTVGGLPLDCNRSNKYAVISTYPEIAEKIEAEIENAKQFIFRAEEAQVKNLSSGGSGGPPPQ